MDGEENGAIADQKLKSRQERIVGRGYYSRAVHLNSEVEHP